MIDTCVAFVAGIFVGANLRKVVAAIWRIGIRTTDQLDREAEALHARLAGPADPNTEPRS